MRAISKMLRKRIAEEQQMEECVHCGSRNVEWDHVWIYAGRQINEIWSIVPLCVRCHRGNNGSPNKKAKESAKRESIRRLVKSGFENLNKYQKPMDYTWENRIRAYGQKE